MSMRGLLGLVALCAGCGPGSTCDATSEPTSPDRDPIERLGDYDGPAFSELGDLEVDGNTVWFCSGVIGLNAYDASDPTNMTELDRLEISIGSAQYPRCHHLALAGSDVYVTNRANSIQPESFVARIDATDPANLVEISAWITPDDVEGLDVSGDHLFLAAHGDGLVIRDRSSFAEIGRLGAPLTNAWTVRVLGETAWIADGEAGLAWVDIADRSNPVYGGHLALGGQVKDLDIDPVNNRLFVAAGTAGVAMVDLDTPSGTPLLAASADTPGSALGVAWLPDTNTVGVADWNDLRLFAVDSEALSVLGHEPLQADSSTESRTLGIAGRGDLLFSGNWTALSSYRVHPDRASGDLDVFPGLISLSRTEPGDTTNALITLSNGGHGPLSITGGEVSGKGLDLELEPASLDPGEDTVVRLSWAPPNSRLLNGWLNIFSDDADEPSKCVAVQGNRTGLGPGDPAPPVSFLGTDGTTWALDSLQGKPVLLSYFATF